MDARRIGILHPGSMGGAVAAQVAATGTEVYWLPEGRSPASRQRAEDAGSRAAPSMAALAETCDLIVSVCPPAAALEVAESVAATDFTGVYLDANAISPYHSQQIAHLLAKRSVTVVDGGIVGPPPHTADTTILYLSGPLTAVNRVSEVFDGSALTVKAIAGPVGKASALKLAFASFTKISAALAAQSCALAASHGVLDELLDLTAEALPHTALGNPERIPKAAARAWRWAPEMREIAEACAAAGLSPHLGLGASALFERWNEHKDDATVPLDKLISDLLNP